MSYKAITIYTPAGSPPHIAAQDDAFIHDCLLRGQSGILGDLTCVRQDDSTVRLSGGGVSNRGFIMYIPDGETHDLTVANGSQGLRRHDLVVAEFTRGGGSTADTHEFKMITGTPALEPFDPAVTNGQLLTAGDVNQIPLFRIVMNGLAIDSIVQVADSVDVLSAAVQAQTAASAGTAAECTGNSATASALQTGRAISLGGDATGTAQFDGSADVTISATVHKIDGRTVFIQETEPSSPAEGDLWFW